MAAKTRDELEAQIAQLQSRKRQLNDDSENGENISNGKSTIDKIAFGSAGGYDTDVYGSVRGNRKSDYLTSINTGDDDDEGDDDPLMGPMAAAKATYSAPKRFVEEAAKHAN
ncbi:unnamed protein product, partial [Anisakis simplex]|uniref:Pre-mRNA-splicing factor SLU7 n=1 Tax=Anisakis simplex TaxID=6269 RepID=A0A0M3J9L4_ANISI